MLALIPLGRGATVMYTQPSAASLAATSPLVFDGVTVIDVQQGRRLPAQRVVIVGNRISAMGDGSTVRVPAGAQVVDARGKYLIPGLWDLHTHGNDEPPLVEAIYQLDVANGVTGIRDAGWEVPLDTQRQWRREILAGTRVGPPRQILSGLMLEGPIPDCASQRAQEGENLKCVIDSADARHVVDSRKAAGADMIKLRTVDRAIYFAAAAEARRLGIPFGGHAEQVTVIEASDSGASIVDHLNWIGSDDRWNRNEACFGTRATVAQCQPVAEHFRRNGTWLVPTLLHGYSDTRIAPIRARCSAHFRAFMTDSLVQGNWLRDSTRTGPSGAAQSDSLGAMFLLQRLGVPLLAGTDEELSAFALHGELATYVAEGLTPLEALQTATLNPAKLLHATDSLGMVAPGKLADLVLLDADPLTDITNTTTIRAVVTNGRYFDRGALDQLVASARALSYQYGVSPSSDDPRTLASTLCM
jgi:hypothetical protein